MAEKSLVWKGKALTERMRAAQIAGINTTMGACVNHARTNHDWQNQTSNLTRSIQITKFGHRDGNGARGQWGSTDVVYALMMELGGTIVPKKAKFLAVPISEAAKAAGSPRHMANLAYVQSIKGQPMLVDQHTGKVHYILKKSVTIKARPYLRPAADVKYPELAKNIRKSWEKLKPASSGTAPGPGGDDD